MTAAVSARIGECYGMPLDGTLQGVTVLHVQPDTERPGVVLLTVQPTWNSARLVALRATDTLIPWKD